MLTVELRLTGILAVCPPLQFSVRDIPSYYIVPTTRHSHLLAALLLYDYTLTIGREIELFWKRSRTSWTFSLFIANRYITLFGHVLPLVYSFWPYSDFSVCHDPC